MGYETVPQGIYGVLPNGDWEVFDSVEAYEDAYYDMEYDLDNCFEIEWPEEYA